MNNPKLDRWYAYMRLPDHNELWEILDKDAVFESPVIHTRSIAEPRQSPTVADDRDVAGR